MCEHPFELDPEKIVRIGPEPLVFIDGLHVLDILLIEGEVEHIKVRHNAILVHRFGNHNHARLDKPTNDHLRRGTFVLLRNLHKDRVLQKITLAEGTPSRDGDVLLLAILAKRGLRILRVNFNLVDHRPHLANCENIFNVVLVEVGQADRANLLFLVQLFQGSPRIEVGLLVGSGPVNQVQVHVVHTERRATLLECLERLVVAMVGVPQFGGHEDLLAWHLNALQPLPNAALVAIGGSGVDVTVTRLHRPLERVNGHITAFRLPHPETHLRHLHTVVQHDRRASHFRNKNPIRGRRGNEF
ncbi:chemotaxis response regulator [Angomonas deanei]|nr:chemotaxis response regulator [Angomonas deanei]|eukprot:EPY38348.1 chemotaxis response regulator [Angomonas deanei]